MIDRLFLFTIMALDLVRNVSKILAIICNILLTQDICFSILLREFFYLTIVLNFFFGKETESY